MSLSINVEKDKGKKMFRGGPIMGLKSEKKESFQRFRPDFRGIITRKEIGTVRKEQNK